MRNALILVLTILVNTVNVSYAAEWQIGISITAKDPWYIMQISGGPFTECTQDFGRKLIDDIIKDTKKIDPERVKRKLIVKTRCDQFLLGKNVTCYPDFENTAFYVWYNSKRECVENRQVLLDSGLF